jgi:hypothetical protein
VNIMSGAACLFLPAACPLPAQQDAYGREPRMQRTSGRSIREVPEGTRFVSVSRCLCCWARGAVGAAGVVPLERQKLQNHARSALRSRDATTTRTSIELTLAQTRVCSLELLCA